MNVYWKATKGLLKDVVKATAVISAIFAVVCTFVFLIAFAPWALLAIAIIFMLGGAFMEHLKEAKEEENE